MLGERLKKFRIEKGLTLKALADAISSSPGFISEVENNKKAPGSDFLTSLKRIYDIDLNWLLTDEKEMSAGVAEVSEGYAQKSQIVLHIDRILAEMDEEAQRDVLKYVEFIKHQQAGKKSE